MGGGVRAGRCAEQGTDVMVVQMRASGELSSRDGTLMLMYLRFNN